MEFDVKVDMPDDWKRGAKRLLEAYTNSYFNRDKIFVTSIEVSEGGWSCDRYGNPINYYKPETLGVIIGSEEEVMKIYNNECEKVKVKD